MQYFIGIVPPEDYLQRVLSFQKKWDTNEVPDTVEPHITVKAQSGLTADESWLPGVRGVCSVCTPFTVQLAGISDFNRRVLYIRAGSEALNDLHRKLVEYVNPPMELRRRYFEVEGYTPHMTLGIVGMGLNPQELEDMRKQAEDALAPFPSFQVNFVRVYQQKEEQGKYIPMVDLPFQRG